MSERPKTILDEYKLALNTKPLQSGAKPPSLRVNIYRNNPGLQVFTGHDNGSGVTFIPAGMDVVTFLTLINVVRHYCKADTPAGKIKIENKKQIPKEQRTDPKVKIKIASETWVGKDEDGRVWISVVSAENQQAPKIQFYFGPNYYHGYKSKEGDGFISQMSGLAWCDVFQNLVLGVMESQGYDTRNGSNNSNSNSGSSNKSYNNQKSNGGAGGLDDDFDDNFSDDFD